MQVSAVFETKLVRHLLQVVIAGLAHFDLNLVADAKLILDVLRAAHAAEDSASDHDTELGGEGLGLLHRVCRQNDG